MNEHMAVFLLVFVCVCVCEREGEILFSFTLCVCVREREKGRFCFHSLSVCVWVGGWVGGCTCAGGGVFLFPLTLLR